jgi:hypothetical protein
MQGVGRGTKFTLALAVASMLGAGALMAADSSTGVTLVNDSKHSVSVFVRYGADGDCTSQPKSEEFHIAAGQSQTVDAAKACICLKVPERDNCPSGWSEVKGGAKRHFM